MVRKDELKKLNRKEQDELCETLGIEDTKGKNEDQLIDLILEAETKAKAEQEAKDKLEAETKAKAEQEAKDKLEAETKAKAEQEAKDKLEAETKAKAEYVIAKGKSITTLSGIKADGMEVKKKDFKTIKIFDNLVAKKFIIKN